MLLTYVYIVSRILRPKELGSDVYGRNTKEIRKTCKFKNLLDRKTQHNRLRSQQITDY